MLEKLLSVVFQLISGFPPHFCEKESECETRKISKKIPIKTFQFSLKCPNLFEISKSNTLYSLLRYFGRKASWVVVKRTETPSYCTITNPLHGCFHGELKKYICQYYYVLPNTRSTHHCLKWVNLGHILPELVPRTAFKM